jgi:hypothetical protein
MHLDENKTNRDEKEVSGPARSYASIAKISTKNDSVLSEPSGRINLGIFKNNSFSDNHPVFICRYGDLNCSVEDFLEALSKKNLLRNVWGITRHYNNRFFEFAINDSTKTSEFLEAEINIKDVTLRIQLKYIRNVHVLVQNIPMGTLVNGNSNAIITLGKHLAAGRGKFESFFCQKVNVHGEDIHTGNVVIIISNWQNPHINPLPRYQNVDGYTLRYKHNGQQQQPKPKNVIPTKTNSEIIEDKEEEMPASSSGIAVSTVSGGVVSVAETAENSQEGVQVCESGEASRSKRKSEDNLGEGGTPSKQTISSPLVENKDRKEVEMKDVDINEDLNFNYDDFDLLKCAEKKS